jgi:hypothetical protein
MRPTLRRTILKLGPALIIAACALAITAAAPGMTLYEGSYSTDLSTSTPGGLAPANGVTLAYPASDIALSWDPVPGAARYQLQIARQESGTANCAQESAFQQANIVLTTTIDDTEWVPSLATTTSGAELWTGAYCWRVRSTGKGHGQWSVAHRFVRSWSSTVTGLKFFNDHDGPVPRTAASPDWATGSSTTRNAGYVTWSALPGAAEYEVQVSPSPKFSQSSITIERTGIRGTNVALLHLPDDTYYWRVRAKAPNGTNGNWSTGSNAFTVRWLVDRWTAPESQYPPNGSVQSEFRIGWTPMPGASHYEFQVATDPGCFWNPDYPATVPNLFGHWVGLAPHPDTGMTRDPHPLNHCRISGPRKTTINNWATWNDMVEPGVIDNINTVCFEDELICEPAAMPYNFQQDFGPQYHAPGEVVGDPGDRRFTGDGQWSDAYDIHWRVRPVFEATQQNESGWTIGSGKLLAYGTWNSYRSGGVDRHYRYGLNPSGAPWSFDGTRCEGTLNPAGECLEHIGTSMEATEAAGVANARSMQFPVFTWRPFVGAGCYLIEIARDPLFNNIVVEDMIGWGLQQSYAMTSSLPDNIEDTGYWWRVVPGNGDPDEEGKCIRHYSAISLGVPSWYGASKGLSSFSDMAVHQTFPKESGMQVQVASGFEGSTPLLRWTRKDVAADDYDGWSQGLEGTSYYQVQLARDPQFNVDAIELKTTIPRIAPFLPSDADGVGVLPSGLWYHRVRAVDRNGIQGAWSATGTFNKLIEAPVPTGQNGGSGAGRVVSWTPIDGAAYYQVQWSPDSGFETSPNSTTTLQTSFRIPADPLGRQFWRVRAVIGDVPGQWSAQLRWVDIVPETRIRYGLNRARTLAGDSVQITGELRVDGSATNGERMRLQRKVGGCDNADGGYLDSSVDTTGRAADDGMVNIPARVMQNTCFRMAWSNGSTVRYSAPIPVGVVPNAQVTKNRKVMRRSDSMCVSLRSNVVINGRWRVQYRVGQTWRTARSGMIPNQKTARTCVQFAKAGRYATRVQFDNMRKKGEGWVQYEPFMRGTGMIRVNDVWRVVRSR